jgi:hypothetical protein
MKTTTVIAAAATFALGGLVGTFALLASQRPADDRALAPLRPAWTEVQWPFPLDEWGKGKAFQCDAAHCGAVVNLYLRAKIGFCNCTTGVSDDEELERLSDFHLAGKEVSAIGAGRPIAVAWMKGRSRGYSIGGGNRPGKSALSVAFNDRCDAMVATVVSGHEQPSVVEPAVIEFLNGKTVLRWAEVTLGL